MKRFFVLIVAMLTVALSACTTTGGVKLPTQTPAQIAAQVCPPVQMTLTSLQALSLDPKVSADLVIANTAVGLACSAGAAIDLTSLQALGTSAMPHIIAVIKASPLSIDQQNQAILEVTAAQIVLQGALQAAANAGVALPSLAPAAPAAVPAAVPATPAPIATPLPAAAAKASA